MLANKTTPANLWRIPFEVRKGFLSPSSPPPLEHITKEGGIRGINGAAVRETLLFVCPAGREGAMGGSRRGEAQESSCALTYFFFGQFASSFFPFCDVFPSAEERANLRHAMLRYGWLQKRVLSFPIALLPSSPCLPFQSRPSGFFISAREEQNQSQKITAPFPTPKLQGRGFEGSGFEDQYLDLVGRN